MRPLIAVLGPTGSGKSSLAIELAIEFGGEIVNCDSVQIYRHLNIGTAKTPEAERRGIPHHLIDIRDPDELFTAGDYLRLARTTIEQIRLPFIAGGTGLYFRALLQGLFAGPARSEKIRHRLGRRSPERLHRLLARLDPRAADRIHANDVQKVTRALEVCILARTPMTTLLEPDRQPLEGYRVTKIGLAPDKEQLADRINLRVRRMFDEGLIEEVRGILDCGYSPQAKALESIGYREALLHIQGKLSLEAAIEQTQTATRQYAKRQRTWFRKESEMHWIEGFGDIGSTIDQAKILIRSAMFGNN